MSDCIFPGNGSGDYRFNLIEAISSQWRGDFDNYMGESSVATGSKRESLRFRFKKEFLVSYKTAYKDGEASLVNVSTGGCAVQKPSISVAVGEKILFRFDIQSLDQPLEIQAACVRLDDDGFAVKFLGIDGADENRIAKVLAAQARVKDD